MKRAVIALLLILSACSPDPASSPADVLEVDAPPPPPLDPDSVATGRTIYEATCAACHGLDLAGAEDWRTPDASGGYPPPPHDSSGHTWHHSDQVLTQIISDPSAYGLTMPAPGLDPEGITAVLDYLKSSWGPDERRFQWERTYSDGRPGRDSP